jgi:hypothetical protein
VNGSLTNHGYEIIFFATLPWARRESNAEQTLNQEIGIACDEVVGSRLAETSRKRRFEVSLTGIDIYCSTNMIFYEIL